MINLYFILFFIDILLYVYAPGEMDRTYMSIVLSLAFSSIFFYFKDKSIGLNRVLNKVYLRHSIFFILCFAIVSFQNPLDYVLGIIDSSDTYIWINTKVVCKALALSNLALISFIIGASMYNKPINDTHLDSNCEFAINNKPIYWGVIILLALYVLLVPKEYLSNGYALGMDDGGVSSIMGYLQAGFISMFTLYSIGYRKQKKRSYFSYFKIPLILAIIYSVLIILTGRRTEIIRIASLFLISFLYCNKEKVNYRRVLVWGIIGIGSISIVGVLRSLTGGSVGESLYMISNYQSISPFTKEYAGSVNTLHIALDNFPSRYNYNYGTTFIPSFFKIIPGLTYLYATYISSAPLQTSGEIFTNIYFDGNNYWGLGSSIVADIYISFAALGVCIVMMLFGYFVKYLEYITFVKNKSPYMLALSFSAYSAFLFACRSTMAIIFLCWAYSCIMIYIVTKRTKHKR